MAVWATPSTQNVGNNPVGIVVSRPEGSPSVVYAYVLDQEVAPKATVLGFTQNQTTGALTPVPGTVITTDATGKTVATGFGAGTTPSAIAIDPSTRFVYITDEATNQLYGNLVANNGALVAMTNGPFATGIFPVGITIDPRGKFLYVANFSSSTVGAYAIDHGVRDAGWIRRVCLDGDRYRANVRNGRTRAWHLSVRLQQSGEHCFCDEARSAQWRVGSGAEHSVPVIRAADMCCVGGKWIAPDADYRSVAVSASYNVSLVRQKASRLRGFLLC